MSDRQMIEIVDLVKEFDGGRIQALKGLDLSVERGEFVAVSGRSGCGKSTMLHLLAALDQPTSGEIWVDGIPLSQRRHLDAYRRKEVGLVFQLHNLLPNLDALQNVAVAMMGTHVPRRDQRARALTLLADVGLDHRVGSRPAHLSGGERQRLAIARALANNPTILLADEPTGSLDTDSVQGVLDLLREIRRTSGTTILMVTHDPVVASAADRVVRIQDGRIQAPAVIGGTT